jgi:AsmA protein
VQGRVALDLAGGAKRFALQVDKLDLDRYLPPPVQPAPGAKPGLTLPTEALRDLRADGALSIGQLSASGLQLSAVQLGLKAEPGVARLKPLRARFYGGQHDGAITLDVRPRQPLLRVEQTLTGIDVAAVLKDYASTQRLSGRGNVQLALEGRGRSGDEIVRSLRGTVGATLGDGAIEGIDLSWAIAQAQSLALRRSLAADANTRRTAFERLEARADIVDGVASIRSLAAHSKLLRLDGSGTTNLVTQALDLKIKTTLLKAPAGDEQAMGPLALATIPVNVTGTLLEPKVRPDLAGMVKARAQQELREKREEVEQKLREKVQDRLKDLFRR